MKLVTIGEDLPHGVQKHLSDRLADRSITMRDLIKLQAWIESAPEVPEDHWFRDFGTFIACGHGPYITTFLKPGHVPYGTRL